jgi:hypothetical protein
MMIVASVMFGLEGAFLVVLAGLCFKQALRLDGSEGAIRALISLGIVTLAATFFALASLAWRYA